MYLLYSILALMLVSSCSMGTNDTMAFVHIFKSGGSTIRDVFRKFTSESEQSLVILVKCSNYNESSAAVVPCLVKEAHLPGQGVIKNILRPTKKYIGQFQNVAGHFPLGLFHMTHNNLNQPIKYMTWMRHPLSMIVSTVLFRMHKVLLKAGIDEIYQGIFDTLHGKQKVAARQTGSTTLEPNPHFTRFSYYLSLNNNTNQDAASILQTLRQFSLIGVLEEQERSMWMLQQTIDPQFLAHEKFWRKFLTLKKNKSYVRPPKGHRRSNVNASSSSSGSGQQLVKIIPSPAEQRRQLRGTIFTTSYVIEQLKTTRPDLYDKVMISLKIDMNIYRLALELHNAQCTALSPLNSRIVCAATAK